MGRRGPAPTPTAILKLRGSPLATKRRNLREPKGPPGRPRCPDWLDEDAKAAWRHLIPQLDSMGVLTRIDGNALARYCRLWSRWRKAEAFLDKNGEMYPLKDEAGKVKCFQPFPQVSIANKLAQQLTRLEQEFGMTPSARTRIQLNKPMSTLELNDPKARFFGDLA
jgi:P27 family predicted phage terminase small subunit